MLRPLAKLSSFVAIALVAFTAPARAEAPPAPLHLRYVVTGGAEGDCPDEAAFRRHVALRLGVDPFVPRERAAERTLAVEVDAVHAPRTVTVSLLEAGGKPLGRRVITEPPPSCEELVANAAFAASVAIDPTVLTRAPPSPPPSPPSEPPAVATPPSDEAPARAEAPATRPAEEPRALVPSVRVGGGFAFGVMPEAAFGLSLGGALRRGAFSAGVEGRFDLPTETTRDANDPAHTPVTLRTSLVLGEIAGCGHLRPRGVSPYLCVAFQAGALRAASSGIVSAKEDASPWLALAPRVGATAPVGENVAIDVRFDVPFALTPVELRVDDRAVWTSPAVAAVVSAGLRFSFP